MGLENIVACGSPTSWTKSLTPRSKKLVSDSNQSKASTEESIVTAAAPVICCAHNSLASRDASIEIKNIAQITGMMLTHSPSLKSLSSSELIKNFSSHIKILKTTQDPKKYGSLLREAEEILVILDTKPSTTHSVELSALRAEFQNAYLQLPEGPGLLTQCDVDYLNRRACVAHGVVCKNEKGEEFLKPPISTEEIEQHFFSLGYSNVMHSREVVNFEGMEEMCDVIMVGKEPAHGYLSFSHWRDVAHKVTAAVSTRYVVPSSIQSLEYEVLNINDYFEKTGESKRLGYRGTQTLLIDTLKDQEKAKRLRTQGFQICTILIYPRNIINHS